MTSLAPSPLRPAGVCTAARCRRVPCGLALGIDVAALDALMPMHLAVATSGEILHAGPTMQKIRPEPALVGSLLFQHFDMRRPRGIAGVEDLAARPGVQLRLAMRDAARTPLKGEVVPLSCGRAIVVNLSFGIAVVEALQRFDLTSRDFSGTDLTIETLFLLEAHTAALEESKRLNRRLQSARLIAEQEAATDRLTGVKNRRAAEHLMARLVGQGTPFGLMHLDLDWFKQVNDTHGHAAGDEVLRVIARRLRECTRAADTVARIGGDEFVIVFHGLANIQRLSELAQRMVARIERPITWGDETLRISASIGITASGLYDAPEPEQMLADADAALYACKRDGRGRFRVAEEAR